MAKHISARMFEVAIHPVIEQYRVDVDDSCTINYLRLTLANALAACNNGDQAYAQEIVAAMRANSGLDPFNLSE